MAKAVAVFMFDNKKKKQVLNINIHQFYIIL